MTLKPDVLTGTAEAPLFSEVQRAFDWWFYRAVVIFLVGTMCFSSVGAITSGNLAAALTPFVIVVALWWFLWVLRLETQVRRDGVYARVYPLHLKERRFGWDQIDRHQVVVYRPIRDYGGWGIRFGRKGWAYNMYGNRGVLLHLKTGKTQLVGSQRAEDLAAAILRARRS